MALYRMLGHIMVRLSGMDTSQQQEILSSWLSKLTVMPSFLWNKTISRKKQKMQDLV